MRPPLHCWSLIVCSVFLSAPVRAEDDSQRETKNRSAGPVEFIKRSASLAADGLEHAGKTVGSGVSWTVSRVSKALGISDGKRKKTGAQVKLEVTPAVVNLDQHRKLEVVVKVVNPGKRAVLLEFPSSQRVDAVIRDLQGHIVARASEDSQFVEEPAVVSVNPGERVEYALTLPTRELKPASRYKLEAAVVHHENLRKEEALQTK
jgi:hypothetical protein